MAMYHFRLKSDKKPNGTKISAVKHVEYINREGSFSHEEHWQENNKFVGDCITTAQTPNALDGENALLYKTDDFGSIKNSAKGIEVTEDASTTTLSIALMLATETMNNQPLIINGSPDFHKAILQTAVLANLPITFADRLLQKEFERLKEKKANDDKKIYCQRRNYCHKETKSQVQYCANSCKVNRRCNQKRTSLAYTVRTPFGSFRIKRN